MSQEKSTKYYLLFETKFLLNKVVCNETKRLKKILVLDFIFYYKQLLLINILNNVTNNSNLQIACISDFNLFC